MISYFTVSILVVIFSFRSLSILRLSSFSRMPSFLKFFFYFRRCICWGCLLFLHCLKFWNYFHFWGCLYFWSHLFLESFSFLMSPSFCRSAKHYHSFSSALSQHCIIYWTMPPQQYLSIFTSLPNYINLLLTNTTWSHEATCIPIVLLIN